MFKVFLLFFSLISHGALAGTFSSLDFKKILNPDGRTEYQVIKYDSSKINWGKEVNVVKKAHSENSCGLPEVSLSRQDAIKTLEDFYSEDNLANLLSRLVKSKKILKAIFGKDGDHGESEYCSTATMKFYSTDGEVLVLSFDFNT